MHLTADVTWLLLGNRVLQLKYQTVLHTDENDLKDNSIVLIYSRSLFFFKQRNRCGTKTIKIVALHNIMLHCEKQNKTQATHSRLKEFIWHVQIPRLIQLIAQIKDRKWRSCYFIFPISKVSVPEQSHLKPNSKDNW